MLKNCKTSQFLLFYAMNSFRNTYVTKYLRNKGTYLKIKLFRNSFYISKAIKVLLLCILQIFWNWTDEKTFIHNYFDLIKVIVISFCAIFKAFDFQYWLIILFSLIQVFCTEKWRYINVFHKSLLRYKNVGLMEFHVTNSKKFLRE